MNEFILRVFGMRDVKQLFHKAGFMKTSINPEILENYFVSKVICTGYAAVQHRTIKQHNGKPDALVG